MNRKNIIISITIMLVFSFGIVLHANAGEKSIAQQFEKEGMLRQALTHYVEALKEDESDQQLRKKIIRLGLKVQTTVPDESLKYMGRGRAAMEIAKEAADFKYAVREFKRSVREAPWLADGYYNLGVAQESAGHYIDAIQSFKLYLLATPDAEDAKDVKTRIFGLEYKSERHQKDKIEKEEQRREAQRIEDALEGIWRHYHKKGIGGRFYDDHLHFEISVSGKNVTMKQVVDIVLGEYPVGHIFGPWQYKLKGRKFIYDSNEEFELSHDLKVLTKTFRYAGKVDRTTYHKCRNYSLNSCGK